MPVSHIHVCYHDTGRLHRQFCAISCAISTICVVLFHSSAKKSSWNLSLSDHQRRSVRQPAALLIPPVNGILKHPVGWSYSVPGENWTFSGHFIPGSGGYSCKAGGEDGSREFFTVPIWVLHDTRPVPIIPVFVQVPEEMFSYEAGVTLQC